MNCYLIAKKLSHSFSKSIHNDLADYSYEYKELAEDELSTFLKEKKFDGLNITIPYKKTVIGFLDEISNEAEKIGAVNTIVNKKGRLYGYNTDYYGFKYLLDRAKISVKGKDIVIIGCGGAAKTVSLVCHDGGAKSVRFLKREDSEANRIESFLNAEVIINASPVGMYPNTGESAVCISLFKRCEAVIDLIYNPARTKIIADAEKMGIKTENGLSMLVAQAKYASEIFTEKKIPDLEIEKIIKKTENQTKNIVLIGMPGVGKTTIGKILAENLGRSFYDIDEEISKLGKTPAEIIEKDGEEEFRKIESQVLADFCKLSGAVIATGGGCVTRKENFDAIRQNAKVLFIKRDISLLDREGRPLSKGNIEKLYEERLPLYKDFADFEIDVLKNPEETAKHIIEEIF